MTQTNGITFRRFVLWALKTAFIGALDAGFLVGGVLFLWIMGDYDDTIYGIMFMIALPLFVFTLIIAFTVWLSRLGVVTKEEYAGLSKMKKASYPLKVGLPALGFMALWLVCFL